MSGTQQNGSHSLEMANSNQDAVTKSRFKSRKYLVPAIAVVVAVVLLTTVVVLVTRGKDNGDSHKEALTLDDVLRRRPPTEFNATWISDTELVFNDGNVLGIVPTVFDVTSHNKTSALGPALALPIGAEQFEMAADRKYAFLNFNPTRGYRHSFTAYYRIVNLQTGEDAQPIPYGNRYELLVWSPKGNGLAVVMGNNIYYRPTVENNNIENNNVVNLTSNGVQGTIYNGVPDWVYEEEILSSNKALWFDPSGTKLAYATYNDSQVPIMTLPFYGRPGLLQSQYTRASSIRYPKAGAPNPSVTLTVVDLETKRSITIEPPADVTSNKPLELPILAVTQWLPHEKSPRLLTVWMNRVQNRAIVQVHDVSGPSPSSVLLADLSEPHGWVDLFEEGVTSDLKSGSVLLPLSHDIGNGKGRFRHVARFDPSEDGKSYKRTDLTSGPFAVSSILSWDSVRGYVYFVSSAESNPGMSRVQRVKDEPSGAPADGIECLSCGLPNCTYASASVSKKSGHLAITCAGPEVPYTIILNAVSLQTELDWERNDDIRESLAAKELPVKERADVRMPGNFTANFMLWLPPNLDTSGSTKYPMLVDVYGGPNTLKVSERYAMTWGKYLSASKGIIYAYIDGRGSASKGDDAIFSTYHHGFGTYEVEDQINVTKYLQSNYPFVDAKRTAIWGWSYGGYVSAMALAKDTQNVFKCGMSVAPVTDWIYYDSMYTERYMGLPRDEESSYRRAQLTNKVDNLRNKQFLLIHGTSDDNVHYQQSMMLSRVLEEEDILFRQQSYPDEDHSINNLQFHLYHTLENFLSECFEV